MANALTVGATLTLPFAATLAVVEEIYPLQVNTGRALYQVKDLQSGLLYALKLFDTRMNSLDAIRREMVALNRVNDPAVFPRALTLTAGGHDGGACLLMDWMPGKPMSQIWPSGCEGPWELRLRLKALELACQAVGQLHRKKLIHRDLKTDNVLVRDANAPAKGVCLIDFGLVAQQRQRVEGTPGFQAPEQEGDRFMNLNEQTDIFALGQIGWALVSGQPRWAFPAGRSWDEPLPLLRETQPWVPVELDHIFARAMAYEPGKRYRTAEAMASELAAVARKLQS